MTIVKLPAEARSLAGAAPLEPAAKVAKLVAFAPSSTAGTGTAGTVIAGAGAGANADAGTGAGVYHPVTIAAKPRSGRSNTEFVLRVDTKAASRWLNEHGVPRACLSFQYGQKRLTRRFGAHAPTFAARRLSRSS